jgi:hypothetical protein
VDVRSLEQEYECAALRGERSGGARVGMLKVGQSLVAVSFSVHCALWRLCTVDCVVLRESVGGHVCPATREHARER